MEQQRFNAIINAREFMYKLMYDTQIPETYRKEASQILRHYPDDTVMHIVTKLCPELFKK